jgi:hypothetical protein
MATPAYPIQLKIASATVTVMTSEATTAIVTGSQYQIVNTAKRAVDPATTLVVKDGAATVPTANVSFDYLFGIVTFVGYTATGAVTITGAYLSTQSIAEGNGIELNLSTDLVDVSVFESSFKKKLAVLLDSDGSIAMLRIPLEDLDSLTAGTQSFDSWMRSGTPKLLDVLFTAGARWRGWVVFKDYKVKSAIAGVIEVSLDFTGAPQGAGAVFSWGA